MGIKRGAKNLNRRIQEIFRQFEFQFVVLKFLDRTGRPGETGEKETT